MKEVPVKRRRDDFTLVELLVVICLASLLFGIVLPAFSRMVTGSAVDRLSSSLKLRLEQAQSNAASSRRHVALILPGGSETTWSGDKEKAARLGGSRMCYVDTPGTADFSSKFQRWIPDEDWTQPDRGAFLIGVYKADPTKDDGTLKDKGTGSGKISYAESLAGTLPDATSGQDKPLKDVKEYDGGGDTRGNCAILFSPKGSMRNTKEVYLVVAEAMVNGGSFLFPGGGVHNFRVLRVDHVTGRVEYYSKCSGNPVST